jgi:hypothetical protein
MKERMKLNLPPKWMVFVKNLNPCVTKLRVLVLCFPSLTDNSIYLACPLSLVTWEVMGAKKTKIGKSRGKICVHTLVLIALTTMRKGRL